jgi:two-component system, chemotaxis family, protein-glutamate methylesterase/glutaminase
MKGEGALVSVNEERLVRDLIVIGASAGGISALLGLLGHLARDVTAIIAIALHRSPFAHSHLTKVLGRGTALQVFEPGSGDPLRPGSIFVAPRDQHMLIVDGHVRVERGPKEHFTRPAIDPLFSSAAAAYGRRVAGVLLSGGGEDGVVGLVRIKAAGGISLVQAPGQAQHPFMPRNAIRYDHVDAALPVDQLAHAIARLAAGECLELPRPRSLAS